MLSAIGCISRIRSIRQGDKENARCTRFWCVSRGPQETAATAGPAQASFAPSATERTAVAAATTARTGYLVGGVMA